MHSQTNPAKRTDFEDSCVNLEKPFYSDPSVPNVVLNKLPLFNDIDNQNTFPNN